MELPIPVVVPAVVAAVMFGYLGGLARHAPSRQPIIVDNAAIASVHPAALYIKTGAGETKRYLIDPLDANWSEVFREAPGRRWHLELAPTECCANRYVLRTAVAQAGS